MDRRKLNALDRDELLDLARQAGIDGAEWLSREELVHTLAAGPSPLRRSLFDRARELFERAQQIGTLLTRPTRAPAVPPPPPAPAPHREPERDGPATGGDGEGGAGFETLTMAEVYASQGHLADAARIAEAMLAKNPDDDAARAVLDRVRAAEGDDATEEPPRSTGADVVLALLVRPGVLCGAWELTESGRASAAAWLGERGEPTLRIVSVTPAGSRVRDVPLGELAGARLLDGVAPQARARLAIGLKAADGRFAPVAHSEAVAMPRATPSDDTLVRWVRVEPASDRSAAIQPPVPAAAVDADLRVQARARRRLLAGESLR
jgi:hypothetical protein